MKVYRDDVPDWLQTASIVLGIIAVCWFVLKKDASAPAPPPSSKAAVKAADRGCGTSTFRCVARSQLKLEAAGSDSCPEEKAKKRIEADLANPLERDDCKSAQLRLSEGCPKDCSLESSPPLVVPGPLVFSSDPNPNESGVCVSEGQIHLTLRGRCVHDLAQGGANLD